MAQQHGVFGVCLVVVRGGGGGGVLVNEVVEHCSSSKLWHECAARKTYSAIFLYTISKLISPFHDKKPYSNSNKHTKHTISDQNCQMYITRFSHQSRSTNISFGVAHTI